MSTYCIPFVKSQLFTGTNVLTIEFIVLNIIEAYFYYFIFRFALLSKIIGLLTCGFLNLGFWPFISN